MKRPIAFWTIFVWFEIYRFCRSLDILVLYGILSLSLQCDDDKQNGTIPNLKNVNDHVEKLLLLPLNVDAVKQMLRTTNTMAKNDEMCGKPGMWCERSVAGEWKFWKWWMVLAEPRPRTDTNRRRHYIELQSEHTRKSKRYLHVIHALDLVGSINGPRYDFHLSHCDFVSVEWHSHSSWASDEEFCRVKFFWNWKINPRISDHLNFGVHTSHVNAEVEWNRITTKCIIEITQSRASSG